MDSVMEEARKKRVLDSILECLNHGDGSMNTLTISQPGNENIIEEHLEFIKRQVKEAYRRGDVIHFHGITETNRYGEYPNHDLMVTGITYGVSVGEYQKEKKV